MIKVVTDISCINRDDWKRLEEESALSNAFQSYEMYCFYQKLSFLEPFIVAVLDDASLKAVIVGYILKDGGRLKQFFSRRAIINGGPLLADDCGEQHIDSLLSGCKSLLKGKSIYIETRNYSDYSKYQSLFARNGFGYEPHYDCVINTYTYSPEELLHRSVKRNLKSSIKNGTQIAEATSLEEYREWYLILQNLYQEKVHLPLFPWEFFEKAFCSPQFKLLLVKYQGRVIGGGLFVVGTDRVYEWFKCGQDGTIKGVHPSTVASYAGIQYSFDHGMNTFDFMGAGAPGDSGYGVRDFKMSFGAELVEYGRSLHIQNPILFKLGKLGVRVVKSIR